MKTCLRGTDVYNGVAPKRLYDSSSDGKRGGMEKRRMAAVRLGGEGTYSDRIVYSEIKSVELLY